MNNFLDSYPVESGLHPFKPSPRGSNFSINSCTPFLNWYINHTHAYPPQFSSTSRPINPGTPYELPKCSQKFVGGGSAKRSSLNPWPLHVRPFLVVASLHVMSGQSRPPRRTYNAAAPAFAQSVLASALWWGVLGSSCWRARFRIPTAQVSAH